MSSSTAERFSEARLSSSGRFSDGPTRAIVSVILSGCPGSGDVVAAVGDDRLIPPALFLPSLYSRAEAVRFQIEQEAPPKLATVLHCLALAKVRG